MEQTLRLNIKREYHVPDWAHSYLEQECNQNEIQSARNRLNFLRLQEDDEKTEKAEVIKKKTRGDDGQSFLMDIIREGLRDVKESEDCTLSIEQKDPTSPLYSVKKFEELHLRPELLKGIYKMGFVSPSRIQETALPILLADPPHNMIAQAQNGTGKSVAFILAMISRIDTSLDYPQALCLAPTYELAIQIGEVVAEMSYFCPNIKILFAVRGEEHNGPIKHHILIGTPGKMLDWALKYKLFDVNKISIFVLDEADVMISTQGHQDQCIRIHKKANPKCQMLLFSATFDNEIMEFAQYIVPNSTIIRLQRSEEALNNVRHYMVKCKDINEKYEAIKNIYSVATISQAIIFCQTKRNASWLAVKMVEDGHGVSLLSSELSVSQRLNILDRFRGGIEKVLIATNVLSRGIDVKQVSLVVNFDMPFDANRNTDYQTYLHRIGRTGRFGKKGLAVNLVDNEKCNESCKTIGEHFQIKIEELNTNDYDQVEAIQSN